MERRCPRQIRFPSDSDEIPDVAAGPSRASESRPLSACSERRVWLKMEAFQPSGSFKLRGIGRACQEYASAEEPASFLLPVAMPVSRWPTLKAFVDFLRKERHGA
jgi:hypothetical protein